MQLLKANMTVSTAKVAHLGRGSSGQGTRSGVSRFTILQPPVRRLLPRLSAPSKHDIEQAQPIDVLKLAEPKPKEDKPFSWGEVVMFFFLFLMLLLVFGVGLVANGIVEPCSYMAPLLPRHKAQFSQVSKFFPAEDNIFEGSSGNAYQNFDFEGEGISFECVCTPIFSPSFHTPSPPPSNELPVPTPQAAADGDSIDSVKANDDSADDRNGDRAADAGDTCDHLSNGDGDGSIIALPFFYNFGRITMMPLLTPSSEQVYGSLNQPLSVPAPLALQHTDAVMPIPAALLYPPLPQCLWNATKNVSPDVLAMLVPFNYGYHPPTELSPIDVSAHLQKQRRHGGSYDILFAKFYAEAWYKYQEPFGECAAPTSARIGKQVQVAWAYAQNEVISPALDALLGTAHQIWDLALLYVCWRLAGLICRTIEQVCRWWRILTQLFSVRRCTIIGSKLLLGYYFLSSGLAYEATVVTFFGLLLVLAEH